MKTSGNQINSYLSIIMLLLITAAGCKCDIRSANDKTSNINTGEYEPQNVCQNFDGGSGSLCDDFNTDSVDTSIWQVASWQEEGMTSPERCYTENGFLNMIFINSSSDGFLSAAIQTWSEFLYGRWEARLKPSSVPGLLNSLYTIDWNDTTVEGDGDGTKQEIDIEFLTNSFAGESGEVHFAVHEYGSTSFNTNPDIALDFNPSDEFHVWGFEITPEHIQWFVDDTVLQTYTYSENDITIDAPYQLKMNVWTQNGGWVGGPPEADTPCLYQIDWIRFTPHEE